MNRYLIRRELFALSLALILIVAQISFGRAIPDLDKTLQTAQQLRPFPPTQYIPDHDFDIHHVALDVRFDWEREQLIGVETMSFKPLLANLKSIELDAAEMTITSIKFLNGGPLQFEMDPAKQRLRIALGRGYQPADELTIVTEYHTNGPQNRIPGLVGAALRFIKPSPDDPTTIGFRFTIIRMISSHPKLRPPLRSRSRSFPMESCSTPETTMMGRGHFTGR